MKVLTIKQPWATLIMEQYKKYEFRSWRTNFRGELLIHAGKGVDKEALERLAKYLPKELPKGQILGQVTITDCIKCDDKLKKECLKLNKDVYAKSTFSENYAWKIENVRVFDNPIEINGKLSLWDYDIENR